MHEGETFTGLAVTGREFRREEWRDCVFTGCLFESCVFRGCKFTACVFTNCRILNPRFEGCEMVAGECEECLFVGVNFSDLRLASGKWFPLDRAEHCTWRICSLMDFELGKYDFSDAVFEDCILQQCAMKGADFRRSRFSGTLFNRCDLREADFRGAQGYAVDLETNRLRGARFSFPEVVGLLSSLDIKIE